MTNPDYRLIVLVMDRSGSIWDILSDMQGGFDSFIAEQKQSEVRTDVSLWQFDEEIEQLCDFVPIAGLPPYSIVPRGGTALNDAVARSVTKTGEKLAAMPEEQRPGTVILVIASDGLENQSVEFPGRGNTAVRKMVEHQQEKYGWIVQYIGTGLGASAQAEALGVAPGYTMDFAPTAAGTFSAWAATSRSVNATTAGGDGSYTVAERSAASE